MTASRDLMRKEKIVDVIQRMPEDATIDDAIDRLRLLKAVAEGLQDAEQGRVRDHDAVFDELLNDNAQNSHQMERSGELRSARNKGTHRKGRSTKNSSGIHPKTKEIHR